MSFRCPPFGFLPLSQASEEVKTVLSCEFFCLIGRNPAFGRISVSLVLDGDDFLLFEVGLLPGPLFAKFIRVSRKSDACKNHEDPDGYC